MGAIVAAPSPADPKLAEVTSAVPDVEMSFDIANYNYYDLEKEAPDASSKSEDGDSFFQMAEGDENFGETVAETIGKVFKKVIAQGLKNDSKAAQIVAGAAPSMPAAASMVDGWGTGWGGSLVEVGSVGLAGAAPAAAPPVAAKVVAAPAAAPPVAAKVVAAPAAAPPVAAKVVASPAAAPPAAAEVVEGAADSLESQVNVFVSFRPGSRHQPAKEMFLQTSPAARTTTVDVVITDKPMTGADLLPRVRAILGQSQENGFLKRHVKAALFQATGVSPMLKGLSKPPVVAQLKQWEENTCEKHMEKLVKLMEVAYTRRMVPQALYNECTNLIPSLTFSHDPVATRLDRKKCRIATIKFAQRWNYGKASWNHGAGKGNEPMDFAAFCHDVCETRFGEEAPQCSVHKQIQKGV